MSGAADLPVGGPARRATLAKRLWRKFCNIGHYGNLGVGLGDRWKLFLFGIVRNRLPGSGLAARFFIGPSLTITPRLRSAGGQLVRIEFGNPGQVDTFEEIFLDRIYDLSAVHFSPALVVDCGGFCGYFSAMAAGTYPASRIVCFEANPDNLPQIKAQLSLLDANVELIEAAVHVRGGRTYFAGSGVGGRMLPEGSDARAREVACVDFPAWLGVQAPESLVLKLDVEGAEVDLLPPILGRLPARTAVFLETHHPDATCAELLGPYRRAGFTVREVRRRTSPGLDFDYIEWIMLRNA